MSSGEQYALVRDEKTLGTHGGASSTGAWVTRVLNTISSNTSNILTLSANRITLLAGTYRCNIRSPFYNSYYSTIRLYNITDAAVVLNGASKYNLYIVDDCTIRGKFTIAESKQLEIQYRIYSASSPYGLGLALGSGITGMPYEIYTEAEFWKVG
jgi:hypothetical protein